jgi:hypothetical protein
MTDWKEIDFHKRSLSITLSSLQGAIDQVYLFHKENSWFDGMFLLEASEPIYGTAFIVMQNYINTSIYDCDDSLKYKHDRYKLGEQLEGKKLSYIELIIGIANYFKHRDDDRGLHNGTSKILTLLEFESSGDIEESPIFESLNLIDPQWKLASFESILLNWRELLWKNKIK